MYVTALSSHRGVKKWLWPLNCDRPEFLRLRDNSSREGHAYCVETKGRHFHIFFVIILNLSVKFQQAICRYIYLLTIDLLLESFEIWCWRRMEKISWTDHVRNEGVLLRV